MNVENDTENLLREGRTTIMCANTKVTRAYRAYCAGHYSRALKLYHEIGHVVGHQCFYANVALCLKGLGVDVQEPVARARNSGITADYNILEVLAARDLVVSLTSYPGRIGAVHEVIRSLLAQSVKPSKVVLWLAAEQFPGKEQDLPSELLNLTRNGLLIEWCHDIHSYKKLIPSLNAYPDKVIVTADDDIRYGPYWLAELLVSHIDDPAAVVCHRGHRVLLDEFGKFLPYKSWPMDTKSQSASLANFFTGAGGVLYPPNSLHESVVDEAEFMRICPTGDDIWFWGMAVINNTEIKIVSDSSFVLDFVAGTQDGALWKNNVQDGRNDAMLRALRESCPQIPEKLTQKPAGIRMSQPDVTVIVPIFNAAKNLVTCLDSVLNQTFGNIEVVCVDDGSTSPCTLAILRSYANEDPRIRVVRQENEGPGSARNNGLSHARGSYIAFVDSDDYISTDYIDSLYRCALRNDADISVAQEIQCVGSGSQPTRKKSGFERYGEISNKALATEVILTTGVAWNKLYKSEMLVTNRIGYLDGAKCHAEDNFFSIMAMIFGYPKVVVADNSTYYYRQHSDGLTGVESRESLTQSIEVYDAIKRSVAARRITDETYWLNVVNARARKDLRHIGKRVNDADDILRLADFRFASVVDVCCITDKEYVAPTMVFLESVRRSKRPTTFLDIRVLVPTGSRSEMKGLESMRATGFRVQVIEVSGDRLVGLHKYKEENNFCMASPSAMLKFEIPNVFEHLDRILYIDTDLIVRGDLSELFMTPVENEYLCAAADLWNPVTDRDDVKSIASYFNSGVMVMNLQKMREEGVPNRLVEAKMRSSNANLMDQDVFNEVCDGRVKMLDVKYNFLPVCYKRHKQRLDLATINRIYNANYECVDEIARNPVIAHWAGSEKPWLSRSTLFSDEWHELYDRVKDRVAGEAVGDLA